MIIDPKVPNEEVFVNNLWASPQISQNAVVAVKRRQEEVDAASPTGAVFVLVICVVL